MKLSIVTSAYNNQNEIVLLYDSLVAQKEYIHEWIVCDDGSTDNTWNLIKFYAKEAPFKIEGLQQIKKGARYAANLNNGFRKAGGDVVFSVNGDSYLNSNALKEIHSTFISKSAGSALRMNLDKEGNFSNYDWRVPNGSDEILQVDKEKDCYKLLTGNGLIIDRTLFEKVGYWDEEYVGYGRDDWDFFLRLWKAKVCLYQYNNVRIFVEAEDPKPDTPANVERFERRLNEYSNRTV